MSGIACEPAPTGGVVTLRVDSVGAMITLARSIAGSGGTFTQFYSGSPTPVYIDTGDGLPTPLDPTQVYTYRLTDDGGTTYSGAVQPALTLNVEQDPLLPMFLKIFSAGIVNLTPPAGVSAIPAGQVVAAMPLTGMPPLPMVTINMDRMGQSDMPIGEDVENVDNDTGVWTVTGFVERDYRISVLATNTKDRDFYRSVIVAIFRSIMKSILEPIGQNVRHKFQVVSGQVAKDIDGNSPGFFYADAHIILDGTFNFTITPNYGDLAHITATAHASGSETEVDLPLVP